MATVCNRSVSSDPQRQEQLRRLLESPGDGAGDDGAIRAAGRTLSRTSLGRTTTSEEGLFQIKDDRQ